jgi:fucose permease
MNIKEKIHEVHIKSKSHALVLTLSLYFLMFAYGLSFTIIGPLIPIFIKQYLISISESGLILLLQGIGGFLSLIAGLVFADTIKKSLLIKIVFSIYGVSLLLIAIAPPYIILLILFFFVGASSRMLDSTLNAYISDIHTKKRGFFQNLLHASFGIGAILGSILPNIFLSKQLKWNIIFLVLGIFCIILFLVFILVQRIVILHDRVSLTISIGSIFNFLKNKNIIILCIISFLYAGLSSASSSWLPTLMNQKLQTSIFLSTIPVTLLWIGITGGRIINSTLSLKFNIKFLLLFSNLLGGMILISTILINKVVGYIIGFALVGFSISAILPLSISEGCNWYPSNTASVSALIILSLNAGIMIIPWVIGIITDKIGFWFSMSFLAALPLLISLFTAFLPNDRKV